MTDQQMETAIRDGYEIANDLFESLPDTAEGGATFHAVWIALTRRLAELGWEPEDLVSDVAWHAAQATSEGAVQ
jgi:hypothetical protein